jgi:dATP pyrophosphohydrolase
MTRQYRRWVHHRAKVVVTMARAPFQVLVLPFRRTENDTVEYGILRRSDDAQWQGIAGGGEDDETPLEAARREAAEEAGIPSTAPFYRLKMQDFVPVTSFKARDEWPADTYLVPQYFFASDATGLSLALSDEHSEIKWTSYEEASELLRYDSNKNALWELWERLRVTDLPPPATDDG